MELKHLETSLPNIMLCRHGSVLNVFLKYWSVHRSFFSSFLMSQAQHKAYQSIAKAARLKAVP